MCWNILCYTQTRTSHIVYITLYFIDKTSLWSPSAEQLSYLREVDMAVLKLGNFYRIYFNGVKSDKRTLLHEDPQLEQIEKFERGSNIDFYISRLSRKQQNVH